jgi:hypothetical protein
MEILVNIGGYACVHQWRRRHSPNAKGNFQFERVILGWRTRALLDLRRK